MSWTAVAIVSLVCWAIVQITRGDYKSNKKDQVTLKQIQSEQQQLKQDYQSVIERLEVLEKIVTDEKYELNKAFNSLKD